MGEYICRGKVTGIQIEQSKSKVKIKGKLQWEEEQAPNQKGDVRNILWKENPKDDDFIGIEATKDIIVANKNMLQMLTLAREEEMTFKIEYDPKKKGNATLISLTTGRY